MTELAAIAAFAFVLSSCQTRIPESSKQQAVADSCADGTSRRSAKTYTEADHYLPWEKDESHQITSYPGYGSHKGIQKDAWDFSMPIGTPVLATVDGFIRKIQFSKDAPVKGGSWAADSANYVILYWADASQHESIYLHLSEVSVEEGDFVKRGTVLGKSGCTGWCTGPHLHYQVQQGPKCHLLRDESYYLQSTAFNFVEEIPKRFIDVTSKNAIAETNVVAGKEPETASPSPTEIPVTPSNDAEPSQGDSRTCYCLEDPCKLNQIYGFSSKTTVQWTNRVNIGSVRPSDTLTVIKTDKPGGTQKPLVAKVNVVESGLIGWVLVSSLSKACF